MLTAMTATSAFGKTYTNVPPGTAPRHAAVEVHTAANYVTLHIDGNVTYCTPRGARELAAMLIEYADKVGST